jgi:hypothetical protein
MRARHREQATAAVKTKAIAPHQEENRPSRREVLAGSAVVGTTILTGALPAAAEENLMKKTFTILHTNDMHSAFIGMSPESDYTPFTLNDDTLQKGQPKSLKEKEAIAFLRDDSQARVAFLDKVAPPVANKLFECGLIP